MTGSVTTKLIRDLQQDIYNNLRLQAGLETTPFTSPGRVDDCGLRIRQAGLFGQSTAINCHIAIRGHGLLITMLPGDSSPSGDLALAEIDRSSQGFFISNYIETGGISQSSPVVAHIMTVIDQTITDFVDSTSSSSQPSGLPSRGRVPRLAT